MPPVKKSPENAPAARPKDAVDSALGLVGPTFEFLTANFMSLFFKMLKVELAVMLVNIGLMVLAGLVAAGMLAAAGAPFTSVNALVNYVAGNRMLLALVAIWALVAELAIAWMSNSISFTALPIVKEQFEGAYSGIWSLSGKMRLRVLGYILLNFVIMVVFLGIPLLLLFLLLGHPNLFLISLIVFALYATAFLLAYIFLSQFWRWELTLGEKQAYEALSASVSLIRENLFGVAVYDAVFVLSYLALAVPFMLLAFGVSILFSGLGLGAALISPLAYLAVMAASALVRVLLGLLDASLSNSALLPYTYSFWNGIRKKQ